MNISKITFYLFEQLGCFRLTNVVIIFILPYDPFDKNRMVYTIQNHCVEDTSIPYHDGARKIFLYTRGTEGNPSQSLKDMLKYIQESTENNVTNSDIASIQKFVDKVKHMKEVGINYMKSWEVEKEIRKEFTLLERVWCRVYLRRNHELHYNIYRKTF